MWKNYRLYYVVFIFLLLSIVLIGCQKAPEEVEEYNEDVKQDAIDTGESNYIQKITPVTVIIDNHANARPQSGLQEATFVYEFLVEGGITRFLAVFDTLPEEMFIIGPVRSLRPYFAHQACEYSGIVAHAGYSKKTAEEIKDLQIKHIAGSSYFYRDSSRKAPHNLYTDSKKLFEAEVGTVGPINTAISLPVLPSGYNEGNQIEISYRRNNKVSYKYSEDYQAYLRFINENPHVDRDSGLQYAPRRVILRQTEHINIPNSPLLSIDLSGEGEGMLFEKGRQYEIYWIKENNETTYYYTDGTPVDLSYANTWIQVVP